MKSPFVPVNFRWLTHRARRSGVVIAVVLVLAGLTGCNTANDYRSLSSPAIAERHVALEGQPNFRDLGGYKTADGRHVKWGLLYRSGALNKLTDADLEKLRARGIAKIIDLRTDSEIEKAPDRLPTGAKAIRLPVGSETNLNALTVAVKTGDVSGLEEGLLLDSNREFVRDFTGAYRQLLQQLAESADRPILWHCTLGKDRAGLGAAIVLMVLGVPQETIMEDYLLSNTFRAQAMRKEMADFNRKHATTTNESKARRDAQVFRALIEVRREFLQAAFDEMIKEYGSREAYIRHGLGVTKARQKRLQRRFLE